MRPSRASCRCLALILVCSILTVRIGSVSHFAFVEPIQNFFAKKALFQDEQPRMKSVYFKAKRMAIENWPWESAEITLIAFPAGELEPLLPFRALPEVYPEIFDPPDNLS